MRRVMWMKIAWAHFSCSLKVIKKVFNRPILSAHLIRSINPASSSSTSTFLFLSPPKVPTKRWTHYVAIPPISSDFYHRKKTVLTYLAAVTFVGFCDINSAFVEVVIGYDGMVLSWNIRLPRNFGQAFKNVHNSTNVSAQVRIRGMYPIKNFIIYDNYMDS